MYERFNIHIDFAWQTFKWSSQSTTQAAIHCVIIGFSFANTNKEKYIYSDSIISEAQNINPYLLNASTIFIESRKKPICSVPDMVYGNKPTDGGNLFLTSEEYTNIIKKDKIVAKYARQILGSNEYINNKKRYCLWLVNTSPTEIKKSKFILDRISKVRKFRLNSTKKATQISANTPTLFQEIRQINTSFQSHYIAIPKTSSENRKYIPIGFLPANIIASDLLFIIPDGSLYHLGIITSNVHMAWMRTVCGRLKSDYRYSNTIVYNNFPWCSPTPQQKAKIEQTAQAILDARALYPDSSLADLYDELTMPKELRRAHQENDKAVMTAYGFDWRKMTESDCVAELMKMYQKLTADEKKKNR